MPRTTGFHDDIAAVRLPQVAGVVDDATAFDMPVDGLDAQATARDAPIGSCWGARAGPAAQLAGRPDDLDRLKEARQAARILEPVTTRRQGVGGASAIR